jgi:alkanesulfonate monooxygenase SsuD/methylene tetrahydromethanopterin reductase-like flavin-dependent oxidoreductase (luciferase family)
MREIEFGTTSFYPAFDGAPRAKLSEEMGFDIQGFSENHTRATDCFGEMRDALRVTRRIKLACGPVNFVTRNPGVVAAAVVPLQVLSEGRIICNVAAGDSAVAAAGLRPQKIADMERDLVILRTLMERGEVEFPGRTSRLEWADALTFAPIPIQTVCSGPHSIALAGRRADRICLGVGTNNERVRWALDIIGEELAKAGRNRDDIRIGMLIPLALAPDRAQGRAMIRTRVAAIAHMQSGRGVDLSQQPEILRRVTSVLRDGYDYRFHHPNAPPDNPNSAVCDEEFGDWMGIGGPPSYVVDRMGELVELGLDFFMTTLPMPEREVFAADVMPKVRALRG